MRARGVPPSKSAIACGDFHRVSRESRNAWVSKVEDVARRQPLIFLGGAFLLGAAASRFIKAAGGGQSGQGGQTGYTGQGDYRSGYSADYRAGGASDYRSSDSYEPTGPGAGTGNAGY